MADIKNSFTVSYGGVDTHSNEVTIKVNGIRPKPKKSSSTSETMVGDTFTYTLEVKNPSTTTAMASVIVKDILDPQNIFVVGSAKLNGSAIVPTIVSTTLSFTIPTIPANGTATITFDATVI